MQQLQAVIPIISIVGTLGGVLLGALLTRRAQDLQWSRDRQIDACVLIMKEANLVHFSLRAAYRRQEKPDWTSWNSALVTLALVAHPSLVHTAQRIDREVWRASNMIKSGKVSTEEDWAELRDQIEALRLDFINEARRRLIRPKESIGRLMARPSLDELQDMIAKPAVQQAVNEDGQPDIDNK